jgi:hypothetical protein
MDPRLRGGERRTDVRGRPHFLTAPDTPTSHSPRPVTLREEGRAERRTLHRVHGPACESKSTQAKSPQPPEPSGVPRAVLESLVPARPGGGALYPPLCRPPAGWESAGLRALSAAARASSCAQRRPPRAGLALAPFRPRTNSGRAAVRRARPANRDDRDCAPCRWGGMTRI